MSARELPRHKLRDATLTLENDSRFYVDFRHSAGRDNGKLRAEILSASNRLGCCVGDIVQREYIRRYLCEQWAVDTDGEKLGVNSRIKEEVDPDFDIFGDDPVPAKPNDSNTQQPPSTPPANNLSDLDNLLAPPKETIMNSTLTTNIAIETKTLVNGKDIKDYTDASIYDLIAAQEAEIERLEAIKTKPKKLVAEIEKRKAGIQALVDHLDSKAD